MISAMGAIGMAVIFVALAVSWRRFSGRAVDEENGGQTRPLTSIPRVSAGARDWCLFIEDLFGGAAFCLDESLCLVAAGELAMDMARDAAGLGSGSFEAARPHLVDLVPMDAVAAMLELAAAVRRGRPMSAEIRWEGAPHEMRAAPVGKGWVVLCMRRRGCSR
jgi:hypothetical protein